MGLSQKTAWDKECCESCRWTISATTVPFLHVLTCTSFSAIIVAALLLIYATSRSLAKLRAKMSTDTYKYQRQLMVSLVLQVGWWMAETRGLVRGECRIGEH